MLIAHQIQISSITAAPLISYSLGNDKITGRVPTQRSIGTYTYYCYLTIDILPHSYTQDCPSAVRKLGQCDHTFSYFRMRSVL